MKITIISFTKNGTKLNKRLTDILSVHKINAYTVGKYIQDNTIIPLENLSETVKAHFTDDAFIFIGAAGIAVRSIAPFVSDKFTDPAVIVIDELGEFVIPVLSGHVGGANELAVYISQELDARPVITTATDINEIFAVDVFAKKNNLTISSRELAKKVSAALLDREGIDIESDISGIDVTGLKGALPAGSIKVRVTNRIYPCNVLRLIPKNLCIGIGCKKNTDIVKLNNFVREVFKQNGLDIMAVRDIASIDVKAEEPAITALAKSLEVGFHTFSREELLEVCGNFNESEFVMKTVGVGNVCERAAMMHGSRLLVRKTAREGMTVAVGEYDNSDRGCDGISDS